MYPHWRRVRMPDDRLQWRHSQQPITLTRLRPGHWMCDNRTAPPAARVMSGDTADEALQATGHGYLRFQFGFPGVR